MAVGIAPWLLVLVYGGWYSTLAVSISIRLLVVHGCWYITLAVSISNGYWYSTLAVSFSTCSTPAVSISTCSRLAVSISTCSTLSVSISNISIFEGIIFWSKCYQLVGMCTTRSVIKTMANGGIYSTSYSPEILLR